ELPRCLVRSTLPWTTGSSPVVTIERERAACVIASAAKQSSGLAREAGLLRRCRSSQDENCIRARAVKRSGGGGHTSHGGGGGRLVRRPFQRAAPERRFASRSL